MKHTSRGFTLIELLVVIAIIGVLSSVVLASLNTARAKARDSQRVLSTRQLKTALEFYYDTNNSYPQYGAADTGYFIPQALTALVPTYISALPVDPKGVSNQYVYGATGQSYGLYIYTESLGTWCVTGVNVNPGWFAPIATCKF